MSRLATVGLLLLIGTLLATGNYAPAPEKPEEKKPDATTADKLLEIIRAPHDRFDEIPLDPTFPLESYVNGICKKFSFPGLKPPVLMTILINGEAFKAEGLENVAETPIVKEKAFPQMTNVTMETHLRKMLERVPTPSGATWLMRKDHIEITTKAALRKQIWGDHKGPFLPLVHARFEKKPLEEALKELAEQSEHNIIFDQRLAEKGKTPVTARFLNTPLDTAATLLADMADLSIVLQDNAIYVTSRENALRIESRQPRDNPNDPDGPRPRIGNGVRGLFLPVPAAM